MKKFFKIAVWLFIAIIFIGTLVFLYNKSKKKTETFITEKPFITNIENKTVATGSIVPRKEIEIKSQISGIVQEIYVTAGHIVKKGDLIAKVKIIPEMISLNNAESRLQRAKISFDNSLLDYERQLKLYEEKIIPIAEFQKVQLAHSNAKQELDAAEDNLQLIKEGVTKKSGQTTNTLIRSTIDGMVLDVPVKEGNSVIESNTFNAGTTIANIADMGEMIFEGKVDETEVGKIHEGMNLSLSIGAIDEQKFDSRLEYISPKGVEDNGAIKFEIKAKVKLKEDFFIRSGYSATVDIVLERIDSVMAIKESLIEFRNDSAFVEVETEPQIFKERNIKLGLSDGINIQVLDGLTKDDKIKQKIVETKNPF
ncbi:MAG: efflux RND transporter periplasmic adaptor subunit [Bacteroidales bacterium]